jgi:hypothetical protein
MTKIAAAGKTATRSQHGKTDRPIWIVQGRMDMVLVHELQIQLFISYTLPLATHRSIPLFLGKQKSGWESIGNWRDQDWKESLIGACVL